MNKTNGEVINEILAKHGSVFLTDMTEWLSHSANWLIWSAFERQATAAWAMGHKRYSARTIGEVIRHHTALSDSGADFKVNDHLWPDLARLHMLVHPERAGFFELRGRRGK